MSIELMETTLRYYHLQSYKILMLALADFANEDGYCWPSIATLTLYSTKSERTVHYNIAKLIERGDIITIPGGEGAKDTNKYQILWQYLPDDLLNTLKYVFGAAKGDTFFQDVMAKRKAAESILADLPKESMAKIQSLESRKHSHFLRYILAPDEEGGWACLPNMGATAIAPINNKGAIAIAPINQEGCNSCCTHNPNKGATAIAPEPFNSNKPYMNAGGVNFGGVYSPIPNPGAKAPLENFHPEKATIRIEDVPLVEPETPQDLSYSNEDPERGGGSGPISAKVKRSVLRIETKFQERVMNAVRKNKFVSPSEKLRVEDLEKKMEDAADQAETHPGKDIEMYHPDWVEAIIQWAGDLNKDRMTITLDKFFSAVNNQERFEAFLSKRNSKQYKGARVNGKSFTR